MDALHGDPFQRLKDAQDECLALLPHSLAQENSLRSGCYALKPQTLALGATLLSAINLHVNFHHKLEAF